MEANTLANHSFNIVENGYLIPSRFCNPDDPLVEFVAQELTKGRLTPEAKTIKLFEWVQNHIKYTVGIYRHQASETLQRRHGSCTNKANLLVAFLRSVGIESAFRYYRVDTQKYFGPLCSRRLTQFMSRNSVHFFAAAKLGGTWIDLDPTDDDLISRGGSHMNPPCKKVHFDGVTPALLNISPDHIHSVNSENLTHADEFMEKTSNVDQTILWVMNAYLEYVRTHGDSFERVPDFESSFFRWLEVAEPEKYAYFCKCEQMLRKRKEKELLQKKPQQNNFQRSLQLEIEQ